MKPLPEQVREWSAKASDYADKAFPVAPPAEWAMAADLHFAELAASWGAEQERAGWLKENAPGGWIDDLRKQAQQQAIQRGIDKILADPVKHGLDLGDKQ